MKGEPVQTASSVLPKVTNPKGVTDIKYYFRFWTSLNVELSTEIFSNCGNVLKFFGSSVLGSPIPRDPSSPKIQNNNLLLKFLIFATIPIISYRLNTRAWIEVENKDLTRLVNNSAESNSVERTESVESNIDSFYSSKRTLPLSDALDSSVPEWWKDWIIRDILPSWRISAVSIDKATTLLKTKDTQNLKNFFEFYIYGLPNGEWTNWRYDFNLCFIRDGEQNSDRSQSLKRHNNLLSNHLLSSAMIAFCEKLLFEVEDPSDKKNYESSICFSGGYPSRFRIHPQRNYRTDLSHQSVIDYAEYLTDSWVKRKYREIGEKFIQDFVEFYSWVYQLRNHQIFLGYEDEFDTLRYIVGQRFVVSGRVASSKNLLIAQSLISDTFYNSSIFILSRIVKSKSSEVIYTERMESTGCESSSGGVYRGDKDFTATEGGEKLSSPINYITGVTKGSDRSSDRYRESDPKEWDWIKFMILIRLPVSIKYLNPGLFISPVPSLVADGSKFFGKANIADSFAGTVSPTDRDILDNNGLELPKILKYSNYTDFAKLPMDERFFSGKPKSQPFNTQHSVSSEYSESSVIKKIVDLCRIKSLSCSSEKCGELVGYRSSSIKKFRENILLLHKPIIPFPSITHPLSPVPERTGRACSLQAYPQFGKLLTEVTNQISSFITLPDPTSGTRFYHSIHETDPYIFLGSNTVMLHDLETENLEYYKRSIFMYFAEIYSLIDAATVRDISKKLFLPSNWYDTLNSWNDFISETKISWISRTIDVCKHNQMVSTYSARIRAAYKYFHPDSFERITGLKEQMDTWIINRNYYDLSKCALRQDFCIWRRCRVDRFGEFAGQTARFYSDPHGILNKIQYLEFFSKPLPQQMGDVERICGFDETVTDRPPGNRTLGKHDSIGYLVTGKALYKILKMFESFISDPVRLINRSLSSKEFYCSNRKLLKSLKYRLDEDLIVPFGYCTIATNRITLHFLHEENIPLESSYNSICVRMVEWTDRSNHFNVQNNISWKHYFNEANTLSFLDFFHNPLINYDNKIFLCGRIPIRGCNRIYMDLLSTDAFKGSNKSLLFARKEPLSFAESNPSHTESRLYSREQLRYRYLVPLENKDFLYRFHFAKRVMSLIWMESHHLEKPSIFPLQKIYLNRSPIKKKLVSFGMYYFNRPLVELNRGEFLTITNDSSNNKLYQKEPVDDTSDIQLNRNDSNNPQLLGSDGCRNSNKYFFHNIKKNIYKRSLSIDFNEPRLRTHLHTKIGSDAGSEEWILVEKYTLWFFTPEWWKYVNNYFSETFPETLLNSIDQLEYNIFNSSRNLESSFIIRLLNLWDKSKIYTFNSPILDYGNSFYREITDQDRYLLPRWLLVGPVIGHSTPYLILTLIPFIYAISQQYLATSMGFNSISLWKRSEIIKYLRDYPWKIAMERSKNLDSSLRQNSARISLINLSKRFFKKLTRLSFYHPFRREISIWLSRKKNVDTSREEKSLVVQYLVTNTPLSRYGFQLNHDSAPLHHSINRFIGKQGFSYFKFLIRACQRYCFTHQNSQLDLLENTMLSALQQNFNSTIILGRFNLLLNTPISLQSGSFPGKGILLVGSTEMGRSYSIKNLAANYCFPLVRIPIKRFLFNKPDFRNTPVVLLSKKCLYRLNLTFELVKKMSPCIVWIQDIHDLNFDYTINESGVNPRSLLHSLLRQLSNRNPNNCLENNIIIAPTHVPARVDPAFISPDRLDQPINIRMLDTHKRVKEYIVILHTRGFHLEIDPARYEDFGSQTMGYSKRDLAILANETLLVGLTQEEPSVGTDTIRLAFYRQGWTIDNRSQSETVHEILLYRIGRTIIRNIFTKNPCMDFPLVNNHLLRKRFYFISDWYLEPPIVESTVKESTILSHILGCLAGLAARDSWFAWRNEQENSAPLARIAENDFQLACGILESLLEEFPRLNLCENELNRNALTSFGTRIFSTTVKRLISQNFSGNRVISNGSIEDNAFSFDVNGLFCGVPHDIYRAPRFWRISFLRGSTYESVRVLSEPDPSYKSITSHRNRDRFTQGLSTNIECDRYQGSGRRESFVGYRRLLTDVRDKHIKTPENRLRNNILNRGFVESGTDESYIQYKMQYHLSNQSNIFLGGRFVWDPTSPLLPETNYPSSRDELFSGERTVKRLYITYSTKRGRQTHSPIDKYKKHFLFHDSNRDSMIESFPDPWNEFPLLEKRYFEYIKINQMIKSHLLTPQLFPIVYPYQVMFFQQTQNIYDHSVVSDQRHRWIKVNRSPTRDSITYTMLFESYQYLVKLFSSNIKALDRIISTLPMNGFIPSSKIEDIFSG
uniref:Ycf2 n=2 Tax=Ophioglossum TaxID=13833 RepID=L7T1H2_9MONI|nr:Ycf2 [Ophioglossum californicum]AGC26689.1 Ycf2 [Ophioglossum californicum]QXF60062.1 Ycf2 [Ophioglossum vulgatum]